MQALAVLWCEQTPVVNRATDIEGNLLPEPFSVCTSYRRPLSRSLEDCLRFCPAIEESCAAEAAPAHCEERCRELHPSTYCEVLTIEGLEDGHTSWPPKVNDLNTRYRLLTRLEKPIMLNGRPTYRSIPSRRSGFRAVRKIDYYLVRARLGLGLANPHPNQVRKIDYYLYSTAMNGFDEWLLDQDQEPFNGATAFVASADVLPYEISARTRTRTRTHPYPYPYPYAYAYAYPYSYPIPLTRYEISSPFSIWSDEYDQWVMTTLNVSCVPGGLEALQQSSARGQPRSPAALHMALALGWAVALGARALGRRRRRKQ